jgi:hypothetical protein
MEPDGMDSCNELQHNTSLKSWDSNATITFDATSGAPSFSTQVKLATQQIDKII